MLLRRLVTTILTTNLTYSKVCLDSVPDHSSNCKLIGEINIVFNSERKKPWASYFPRPVWPAVSAQQHVPYAPAAQAKPQVLWRESATPYS